MTVITTNRLHEYAFYNSHYYNSTLMSIIISISMLKYVWIKIILRLAYRLLWKWFLATLTYHDNWRLFQTQEPNNSIVGAHLLIEKQIHIELVTYNGFAINYWSKQVHNKLTSNVKLTTNSSFASINTRCEAMDGNALLRELLSDNSGGANDF